MLSFGLNHMTAPQVPTQALLRLAASLGCVGVELRNDLSVPLFDGAPATSAREWAEDAGLRILGLAELYGFNIEPATQIAKAGTLMDAAVACGAEGVALIPQVAGPPLARASQRDALRAALEVLRPMLEARDLIGLIEPLGFEKSSLRFKADVAAVLDDMGRPACFGLIHDTFHHHLSGETAVYADLTRMVHISGVVDPVPTPAEMTDAHRVLVDADDRLGSVTQMQALLGAGYRGAMSIEAFSPEVHSHSDLAKALAGSIAFITSKLALAPA